MNTLKKYLAVALTFSALSFAGAAMAQEAPDVLVKRISQDVIESAKADKGIQGGNQQRILSLVEEKIIPFVDFERMTSLAAGRFWREATPEQKKQLTTQFRSLLVYTYSGALAQVRDQKIDFKPMRGAATDTEVEVRSQVIQPRGEPIQLNYRMEKLGDGWKIYDVNVLGAWLVESYKGTFASEISRSGIDGLIKTLADKNKGRADKVGK
ncbi:MlaC/ttg2D family ABC transporter substrate-binding protein [Glaciimonas immobilis]|uniref:Phospholipid transport system substrate-binding protein n=1 Tax=Glaciimonas immobilis TaxID=728004 RepID=A0A840RUI1_9BURK|nr:ABC transporter substrate-binding protein [Glaciimonas immobilis]KAF3999726.1 ABC transporter substrate-binding protein [Glaciimonas immobilis]MBB5200180.1 phospholipid transport system substrate-binding protein [Glaciimonas immobilis]